MRRVMFALLVLVGCGGESSVVTEFEPLFPPPSGPPAPLPPPPPAPVTVRTVYAIPSDREFRQEYSDAIAETKIEVQHWYADQMPRRQTFIAQDTVPVVCGLRPHDEILGQKESDPWPRIFEDLQRDCTDTPEEIKWGNTKHVWAIYVDVKQEQGAPQRFHSAYIGDSENGFPGTTMLDGVFLELLVEGNAQQKGAMKGTVAHELGHTFGLLHPWGCDRPNEEDSPCAPGTLNHGAVMGPGAGSFPDTYLLDYEIRDIRYSGFLNYYMDDEDNE